jgi:hypothetical protein
MAVLILVLIPFILTASLFFLTVHQTPTATMDKEMERLELLSLVNRVSQEIFNFTGNQDKTLAEFVISVSLLGTCGEVYR